MTLHAMHPAYSLVGMVGLTLVSAAIGRLIPFARSQLQTEAGARLVPLDGLRGILCFAVLFHHAAITYVFLDTGNWDPPESRFYRLLGESAVAMFFCITGFLFWARALTTKGDIAVRPFLRSRVLRVGPLYLFACAVAIAIVAPQIPWTSLSTWIDLAKMSALGVRQWGTVGPVNVGLLNSGVTWTLQYEWAFYLAFPAIALLARPAKHVGVALLAAALLTLIGNKPYLFFFVGIVAAYAGHHVSISTLLRGPLGVAFVLAGLCLFPVFAVTGYSLIALALSAVVFVPIACGNSLLGLLHLRGLRLMGLVSYSVYLLHGFAIYLARPLLHRAKAGELGNWQTGDVVYWCVIGCLALIVMIVSLATYRWIEWPFMALDRRLRLSREGERVPGRLQPSEPRTESQITLKTAGRDPPDSQDASPPSMHSPR